MKQLLVIIIQSIYCFYYFSAVIIYYYFSYSPTKIQEILESTHLEANGDKTPPNRMIPSTSHFPGEKGQGDGFHNCELLMSPVKKTRLQGIPANNGDINQALPVKYIKCEGTLEFTGESTKKHLKETKWSRPCKLHVAYTSSSFEDCTIHLIIYEGNMKCRRNLLKEFDSCEAE